MYSSFLIFKLGHRVGKYFYGLEEQEIDIEQESRKLINGAGLELFAHFEKGIKYKGATISDGTFKMLLFDVTCIHI